MKEELISKRQPNLLSKANENILQNLAFSQIKESINLLKIFFIDLQTLLTASI